MARGADGLSVLGSLGAGRHPALFPWATCSAATPRPTCPSAPGATPSVGRQPPVTSSTPRSPSHSCFGPGRGGRPEACSRRRVPKAFSGCSADGPRPGDEPPVSFLPREQGPGTSFPTSIPLIQQLLNATELTGDPAAHSRLVAVLVYTAERAKFATGGERQDWMELFVDTFKLVHRDIVGDPETALALC